MPTSNNMNRASEINQSLEFFCVYSKKMEQSRFANLKFGFKWEMSYDIVSVDKEANIIRINLNLKEKLLV